MTSENSKDKKEYSKNLKESGYKVLNSYLSKDKCQYFISLIDKHIEKNDCNIWSDNKGADKRVYFIEQIHEEFCQYAQNPHFIDTLKRYLGYKNPKFMVLAARLDYVEGNEGSGGGWHRDSPYSNQFKTLCYLTDVTEDNGPFEVLENSHKKINIIKSLVSNVLSPGAYRFNKEQVKSYLKYHSSKVKSFTGRAGDLIMVDTKLIHRGRPIKDSSRYVLFCYYWDKKIPDHFVSLQQLKV